MKSPNKGSYFLPMRYHYERKDVKSLPNVKVYSCDHPMYSICTLYLSGDLGLAVVQKRFNERLKLSWYSNVDAALSYDIAQQPLFEEFMQEHAALPDENGLYPTMNVRKVMWALRMKPLRREYWEQDL